MNRTSLSGLLGVRKADLGLSTPASASSEVGRVCVRYCVLSVRHLPYKLGGTNMAVEERGADRHGGVVVLGDYERMPEASSLD